MNEQEQNSQTAIELPDEPTEGECAYCRKPAFDKVVSEKGGTKKINTAITFWVCSYHLDELRKNNESIKVVAELEKDVTTQGYVVKGSRGKRRPNWMDWLK